MTAPSTLMGKRRIPFLKWTVRLALSLIALFVGYICIIVIDWHVKKRAWDNNPIVKSFWEANVTVHDNKMLKVEGLSKGIGRHDIRKFMTRNKFNRIETVHPLSEYYETINPYTDIFSADSVTHPLCNFRFTVFATFNAEQELENLIGKVRDTGCV